MTERGPGAPDPAEPSNPGELPAPASRPQAIAPPADLGAVRRTDAIIESLAERRAAGSAPRTAPGPEAGRPRRPDDPDPAVRLLRALINDVDDPGPGRDAGPEPTPPPPPAPSGPGARRRGSRTIVALGVAGAVLASTGVAAAGGGAADHSSAAPAPSTTAGTPDDAEKTGKTVQADTDAGTHAQPRPPVRPAPDPGTPTPAPKSSGDPEESKPRPRRPFPPGTRHRLPDFPAIIVQSAPADAPSDDADEIRRRLEELRKLAQKHQRTSPNENGD